MSGEVRGRVDAALDAFITAATGELAAVGDELAPMAEAAREFVVDTGKRLRPAFCFWGARAAGAADTEVLIRAAASLELLQACALIHDDVIDHSDTRRGRPAVHRRFADLHRTSGWTGDADDFGAAAAILLGDVLLAWSETMLATSGIDDDALRRARPVADAMRLEVMAGQYLDVVEQAHGGVTVERALRVARYKSAKYTVERPLHLGAAIAGAGPDVDATFTAYGIPLGEAFQLRDDLLGVFGDPQATGKPAGDDLREGKQTVLVALTLERAPASVADELRVSLGDPSLDDSAVERLRRIIEDSGAAIEVETMIAGRLAEAVAALDQVSLESAARDELAALAAAASYRHD
ncbi:MAG TPA: polyprenyl synthetase family protein [Mycobacteriales bacterium]|nr:polyprenyl synthetase family protein [Mycobacteriales bacterium]